MFSYAILFFNALLILANAVPVSDASQTDADASAAQIVDYGVNGSGCAPGTVSTTLSDNASALQASFSSFLPSVSTSDFRKNCQATLTVKVPANKQFTVRGAAYDGYVQVGSGTTVSHSSLYYFQGSVDQKTSAETLKGPISSNVNLTNTFIGDAVWSACGGSSIVNVDIAVIVDGKSGYASVDSAKIGPFTVRDC